MLIYLNRAGKTVLLSTATSLDTEEMDEAIPVVSTEEHLETPWECPDSSI